MGLPIASMYAKSHANYYIPVHSRVSFSFSLLFVHQICMETTLNKVYILHQLFSSLPLLNLRFRTCGFALGRARENSAVLPLFERSAGLCCYRGISKASPPAGCLTCRQTCMGSKMQAKKSELAFSASHCLTHSNQPVIHGSPPSVPHSSN